VNLDFKMEIPVHANLWHTSKCLLEKGQEQQQARDGGAMDQGRQAGGALDAAVVSPVPGE